MYKVELTDAINALCYRINGICMKIHTEVGPGFPEEYYQRALEHVFADEAIPFEPQKPVPIMFRDIQLGINYLDFLIDEKIILEIKSANVLSSVHMFQTLKYIGYTGLDIALLINFGKEKLEYKRVLATQKMLEFRREKSEMNFT